MIIQLLAFIGLILSVYALYVKYRSRSKQYKPWCDITENISCTKAFASRYGSLAVLPNPVYGVIAYLVILTFSNSRYVFYLSMFLFLVSLYLAYLSYVKQKNFCLVCTAIYVINIILFIVSY